jgi:hypothetical protein
MLVGRVPNAVPDNAAAENLIPIGECMKLVPIGAFILVFASMAALISNGQSGRLIEKSWRGAANAKLTALQRITPAYASRILGLLPEPFRQKFASKVWQPVELMTLRSLLLWHMARSFRFHSSSDSSEARGFGQSKYFSEDAFAHSLQPGPSDVGIESGSGTAVGRCTNNSLRHAPASRNRNAFDS